MLLYLYVRNIFNYIRLLIFNLKDFLNIFLNIKIERIF